MPIPVKMADLSATAASNSPAGTDAIGNSLDDYLRATQSVIRLEQAQAAGTLASASTVDLSGVAEKLVQVTGTTTINNFGTVSSGISKLVRFAGILTITNSAAIVTHTGGNITTAAGDIAEVISDGSGNWRVVSYSRCIVSSAAVIAGLGYTPANKAGDAFGGSVTVTGSITASGSLFCGQNVEASGATLILAPTGSGTVLFRPSGSGSGTGQCSISSAGALTVADELTFNSQLAGYRGIPQNSQSGNYTCVLADSGKEIYHASGAGAGDTFTIPANGSVAYPIGTVLTFGNDDSNALSIAITTDTMRLAGVGTTGTRTLAQYGVATARKVTATEWRVSGVGLT